MCEILWMCGTFLFLQQNYHNFVWFIFFHKHSFFLRLTNELPPRKSVFFVFTRYKFCSVDSENFVVWFLKIEFFEYIVIKLQLRTY